MEIIKKYQLGENYQAIVEVDSPAMWIYIEFKYRVLFGLIPWSKQIGCVKGFVLGDKPDGSRVTHCFNRPGRIARSDQHLDYRNFDTFYLEVEISLLFNSIMDSENERLRKEKILQSKLNQILQ